MSKALRGAIVSKAGAFAVCAHLLFVSVALREMWTIRDAACTEAVVRSAWDRPVAGRYFFYHYAQPHTRAVVLLDLPALAVADAAVETTARATSADSTERRSWTNAAAYGVATTLQWALVGAVCGFVRERRRGRR